MSAVTGTHGQHYSTQPNKNPQANGDQAQSTHAEEEEQQLVADRPPERPEGATEAPKPRRPRGFAAMDRKLVSEIARKGGKAAHSAGTAHEFTTEEARIAGRKGGRATHAKRRAKIEGDQTTGQEEGASMQSPNPEREGQGHGGHG
jgi:general stress protein YciG